MNTIWQDAKYALRTLRKRPGFTVVALATLVLGIGANISIFGVVNTVLLKPLPYPEAERIVAVWDVQQHYPVAPASYPEFLDWREADQVFDDLAAYLPAVVTLTGSGEPERLSSARVSAGLLPMLGVTPALGRLFTPEDEPPGAERVALISHAFWQRRLGGEADPIGRILHFDGESTTVVGVVPPGGEDQLPSDIARGTKTEVWFPLRLDTDSAPRGMHFLRVVGRLRSGLGLEQAQGEIEAFGARLRDEGRTHHGVELGKLRELILGNTRPVLLVLLGAVGFVLLIGCANVANLLLARASVRQREIAVRMAMGASRARLIRQLVTESLVLAIAGGALGLVAAWGSLRWFAASGLGGLPRVEELAIDGTVVGFTIAVALGTALLFGLAPAFQGTATQLAESFKEGARQAGSGRHRMRNLLVVAEVALSLILLIGAGLLVRSFLELLNVKLGFDPDQVVTFGITLPRAKYPEGRERSAFFDQTLERVAALPGVSEAAIVASLPVTGGSNGSFEVEGSTWPDEDSPLAEKRRVSPDYFRVMRIPLLQGRFFNDRDTAGSPEVALVNQEFVRRYFGEDNPLGKWVDFQWGNEGRQEIIGVVGDVRHRGLAEALQPAIYVPFSQNSQPSMMMVVRSGSDPLGLVGAVREQVLAVDKDQPISQVQTMNEVISGVLAQRRLAMSLLSAFAAVALLLAMLGIYGVMSYSANQRTREMGVRMALGAGRGKILALVVSHGMTLAVAGVAVGLAGAFALTRYLSAALFSVSAIDPLTFMGVAPILLAVALVACYLPGRRASRVDP
ncbi:MAG: ABC transporter permease, partial [bacterium]|nr:ABC transporter permease [bacterium]